MATISFSASNWIDSTPTGLDVKTFGSDNVLFNRSVSTLVLDNTDHTIVKLGISGSTGTYKYGYLYVKSPEGTVLSWSDDLNGVYAPISYRGNEDGVISHFVWKDTKEGVTGNKEIYINVNATEESKTRQLDLHFDLGIDKNDSKAAASITVDPDCTHATPIGYIAGVHPYSPYDARDGSSTLTTNIYSLENLGTDVTVWNNALFTTPALPYYYGSGSNVYQVGEELNRNYGTVLKIRVRPRLFSSPKVSYRYEGPTTNWYTPGKRDEEPTTRLLRDEWHDDSSYTYTPMNIEPYVGKIGEVSRVYSNASIPIPTVYQYYLTHGSTFSAAQEKWRFWDYNQKKHYKMNGSFNALYKLASSFSNALTPNITNDGNYILFSEEGLSRLMIEVGKSDNQIGSEGLLLFNSILLTSELSALIAGSQFSATFGLSSTVLSGLNLSAGAISIISIAIIVIAIVLILISIFKKIWLIENLPALRNIYSSGPFIEVGNSLYKDDDLTTSADSVYYSDGIYTYSYPSTVGIKSQTSTYSLTNIDISDNGKKVFRYGKPLKVDDPSYVTNWKKLIALPYTSGKPVPGKTSGGDTLYSSDELSIDVDYNVGTFELKKKAVHRVDAGIATSYVSLADANAKAANILSSSANFVTESLQTNEIDNYLISSSICFFTHEIKVEERPKKLPVFYTGSLTAGTTLYYDETGRVKVLNGYYSTGSAGSNFRDFILVESGSILKTETMANSGSTTTVSGKPVVTTDLNFSSGWAIYGDNRALIQQKSDRILNTNLYDTSKLLGSTATKRVIASGSNRASDGFTVKAYDGVGINSTASFDSSLQGWYKDITNWGPGNLRDAIPSDNVFNVVSKDLTFNFREDCSWQSGSNNERGVYVETFQGSTATAPTYPFEIIFDLEGPSVPEATYRTTLNPNAVRTFVPVITDVFEPNQYFTSASLKAVIGPNPINGITLLTGSATISSSFCAAPAGGGETVFISADDLTCDPLCWATGKTDVDVNISSDSTEAYADIVVGTYITEVDGNMGGPLSYIAVAASSTSISDTSNVKVLEVDNFGFVSAIVVCNQDDECSIPF